MMGALPHKVHRNRILTNMYELPNARRRVRKVTGKNMLNLSDLLSQHKIESRGKELLL